MSAPDGPIDLAITYPGVQQLLRAHLVHWMVVRDRMEDILPLYDQDVATSKSLAAQLDRLGQIAAEHRASRAWFMDRGNIMSMLATMAGSYGVGRLALETVETPLEYAGGEEGAIELANRTNELVDRLNFSNVIECSKNPSALAAAVHSVNAEQAAGELKDPIGRLRIHAAQRGFLVAIAQEALTGDPDGDPVLPARDIEDEFGDEEGLDSEVGELFDLLEETETSSTPRDVLESLPAELLAAYSEARATNTPIDALFAAIAEVVPAGQVDEVRSFALGELDGVYGAGSGYRATAPLLVGFDVLSGYSLEASERARAWQRMGMVDLAEAIATDPLLTDSFLWAMHHNVDDDAGTLTATAAMAIVANSKGARTKTGRKIKVDQATSVLRLLAKKAHETGPEHQEMWCTSIANVVAKNAT